MTTYCKHCGDAYDYEIGKHPIDQCFACVVETLNDERLMAQDVQSQIAEACEELRDTIDTDIRKRTRSTVIRESLDELKAIVDEIDAIPLNLEFELERV